MKTVIAALSIALLFTDQAMASATTWRCKGARSSIFAQAAYGGVTLSFYAKLTIDGQTIKFGYKDEVNNFSSNIQQYQLEKYKILFIPQSDDFGSDEGAKAIAVIFSRDDRQVIALDTLSCKGI